LTDPSPGHRLKKIDKRSDTSGNARTNMAIELESYDSEKHDEHTVARLIFDSRYTRCAIHEANVVGVFVGFPISEKAEIDQKSGKDFARTMGFFRFLARMPLFVRVDRMMPAVKDERGYYVHTIAVDPEFRGRVFGRKMIEQAAAEHDPLYLHVNRDNEGAIRFYERNGFKRLAEGSMMHKGHELSQVLMCRS
jgi:ribosomal protein S18 acetylase RimI-like enzyme